MEYLKLGRTGLQVSRTGFGALPIQRTDLNESARILRRACEGGITFFDTARGYSDSEEKIGHALADVREQIVIATKSGSRDADGLAKDLETSLGNLKTDYVDILQLHNPPGPLPDPDDGDSAYAAAVRAREQGKVRFIGISNHRRDVAKEAAASGLFDTVQFPLSAISSAEDLELIDICRQHDVGVIAMKGLCGGLLTNARAAFAFLRQYENVVPIWGIQRMTELEEFLALEAEPPSLDEGLWATIEADREELSGDFCRACGYCLPCAAGIPIPSAARVKFFLKRAPTARYMSAEFQADMAKIEDCEECGHCRENCPYELDTPALLRRMLDDYRGFLQESGTTPVFESLKVQE